MKNIIKISLAFAFSMFFLVSCSKDQNISEKPQDLVTITFSAEKAGLNTKTAAVEGETSVSYIWTNEDIANIKLFTVSADETLTEISNPTVTKVSDNKLTISAQVESNATYTFRAILCDPASYTATETPKPRTKSQQSPKGIENFDPTADILVSDDNEVSVDATGTTTGDMLLTFHRKVVVNKMTLKNIGVGEKVKKVVVTSTTGDIQGYLNGNVMSGQSKEITLNYENVTVPNDGLFPVYFITIPKTGIALKIDVTTDKYTYTKSFADGKSIDLNLGQFTKFNVALSGRTPVTDFVGGDYFITGSYGDDIYAAKAYSSGNNLSDPIKLTIDADNERINYVQGIEQHIFTFSIITDVEGHNGEFTIKDANNNYLYAASSSSNYLKGKASLDENGNSYWKVEKNGDGSYTITAKGNNTHNLMRFNPGLSAGVVSNPLFNCYVSGQNPITLYPASWCTIVPSISVQSSLSAEAAANTYTITVSRTNYDGAITVTAPSGCNWISTTNVAANANTFTIEVAANTGEERSATLTLSGTDVDPVELVVTQAAAPTLDFTTIAELNAIGNGLTNFGTTELTGTLSNAIVSYVPDTQNAIIKDETGSILVFIANHGYKQGQTFSGELTVTVKNFNNLAEITASNAVFTGSETIVNPETVSLADLVGNYVTYQSAYVTVNELTVTAVDAKNATVTNGSKSYIVFTNYSENAVHVGDVINVTGTVTRYKTTEEIKVWSENDVTTTQEAPYFNASMTETTISHAGGNLSLSLEANVPWTVTVNNNASLKIGSGTASTSVTGSSSVTVTVIIPENENNDSKTYTLSFSSTNSSVTVPNNITITQSAKPSSDIPTAGTVMWAETWTGSTTTNGGDNTSTPSANYGKGTTVYNNGTVAYTQSANTVYVRNENLAGGDKPELILASGKTWTISDIPTGGATTLSLVYKSNNTKSSVTCSTSGVSISGSSKSYTITTNGASTITLVFGCSGNTRIDDVELTVK